MGVLNYLSEEGRDLHRLEKKALKVMALENKLKNLSDDQLRQKTQEFKERYNDGESLDSMLVEAFAVAREAGRRVLGLFAYKEQIMGGIVMFEGNIAELKTGEGKTLVATMPTYLEALAGKGVHVITVNEYLSERDAKQMGEIYRF